MQDRYKEGPVGLWPEGGCHPKLWVSAAVSGYVQRVYAAPSGLTSMTHTLQSVGHDLGSYTLENLSCSCQSQATRPLEAFDGDICA
jgi:hypothetical protein